MTQPATINLNPNEYTQGLHFIHLRLIQVGCNTLSDLSSIVCVPNKTEDLNISMFNMITGISESEILAKHVWCKCKVNLMVESVIQIKSGIMVNVGASVKNIIHRMLCGHHWWSHNYNIYDLLLSTAILYWSIFHYNF